jgi:subfamily B ATP-binding cassette protein MsbA
MFGAATADPETFFGILFTAVPVTKSWFPSIVKGIECLREGEERVADMKNKKKKDQIDKDDDDDAVSYEQLLEEICQRIQWKFILSSTITGLMVKYIAYEKPKVVGHMLDSVVLEGASTQTSFWPHFRPLVLFVIADYILVSMREYYKHGAAHRFNRDAKSDMIANILNQDEDFIHSERHSAGFTHLMNVECNRMQKTVNESVTRLCFGVVTTVWGVWSLVHVDRRLALLGILFKSPLLTMLQSLSRKDIVKYGRLYDASQGAAHRVARSVLCPGVIHLLQANVAQHKAVGWYREKQEDFIQYLEYTHFRQTLLCLVRHGLNNCEDVLLLAMGMTCVLDKTITMGMYFTFRSHLNQLDQGFKELIGLWDDISTIRLSSMVYFELLYRKSKIRNSDGCIKQLRDENKLTLSLNNVSFAYRLNPSVTVLDGINLQLEPGKVIALCGPSGGGKSTVTRLLQRFYDPTEGSVELNNVDIRTIDLKWLRKQIRVIDQDPVLPDLTIFENIALGLGEEASKGDEFVKEQVIEAAKLADAHNFISTKCEKGYDTPVRFISRLSGGERQRIAVARALISHAPIIICDEITASLDAETEQTVISTLSRAMEGKAVLLIAHRLSTIRHADEIAFMEKGKMVERGSHDELVKLNGRYAGYLKTLNSPESFG